MTVNSATRVRLLLAFLIYFFVGYLFTGHVHWTAPTEGFLETSFDEMIPFVPWTVWIYSIHFLLMMGSFFIIKEEALACFVKTVATVLTVSFVTFFIYPTAHPRSEFSTAGATALLWHVLYAIDVPANCFPSLHISLAACYSCFLIRNGNAWRYCIPLMFCLTAVSVLTTRQHYLADIAGGLILAGMAYRLSSGRALWSPNPGRRSPDTLPRA